MNSLVIGNTSQLSHYFPENYIKVSSREIDLNQLKKKNWDKVYICIGESRKFIKNISEYDDVNFTLTVKLINELKNVSNKIVVYSTCELWNKYSGSVDLNLPFDFYKTPYLESKFKLTNFILNKVNEYNNVIILFPFNFNSVHRDMNFLFGKVFSSIINKTKIEIGDTYFHRDMIHPKYVVEESIISENHKIIGSGRLTFVNDFIRDLYENYDLNYNYYVKENKILFKEYEVFKEYYLKTENKFYDYKKLLSDTIEDIDKILKK